MLNSFKDSLTKVTDLVILFASIFTFLAFITPKEAPIEPLNKSREAITLNQSELRSTIEAVSQSRTNIESINNLVNQLNGRLAGLDTELDSAIIQDLQSQIASAAISLQREQSVSNNLQESISALEASIDSELQNISYLENQTTKSISWIQPVRKNVEALANAAGRDGILAGFAALIFCLVCKRRQDWFRRIFSIFYK
jgi:predicted RNase H-like nuclease (RuvC/YqgF family)